MSGPAAAEVVPCAAGLPPGAVQGGMASLSAGSLDRLRRAAGSRAGALSSSSSSLGSAFESLCSIMYALDRPDVDNPELILKAKPVGVAGLLYWADGLIGTEISKNRLQSAATVLRLCALTGDEGGVHRWPRVASGSGLVDEYSLDTLSRDIRGGVEAGTSEDGIRDRAPSALYRKATYGGSGHWGMWCSEDGTARLHCNAVGTPIRPVYVGSRAGMGGTSMAGHASH